jgi:predicted HTH domain antitoxin
MAETISVRLDEKTLRELEELAKEFKTDRSEALRRALAEGLKQAKFRRVVELLRQEKVSIGKAAELAEMSIYEMLEVIEREKIPYGYSKEDLERDLVAE